MRKIFGFIMSSLDGYYEGPNQEFDWPVVDDEFLAFSVEQLDEADTLLFGRTTYEGMAAYWPTPEAIADAPEVASRMNGYPKIVVSRTLGAADWAPSRIINDGMATELTGLKALPGKDITVLGSSSLTAGLLELGVLDELRIMVAPVLLGAGRSVLHTLGRRVSLTLLHERRFESGNLLLTYRP
jgi:dihydrofolate reductase